MNTPDWAAIKAADAAYLGMVAAWIAAVATVLAGIAASAALVFARRAAIEGAKQARASMKSVILSRKAVVAAQGQIDLLKQQLDLSQPRPVVYLYYANDTEDATLRWINLKNIGEDLAFDVQVGDITVPHQSVEDHEEYLGGYRPAQYTLKDTLTFPTLPLMEPNAVTPIRPFSHSAQTGVDMDSFEFREFVRRSIRVGAKNAEALCGDRKATFVVATSTLTYRNVRGASFRQEFEFLTSLGTHIEAYPLGSLVKAEPHYTKPA